MFGKKHSKINRLQNTIEYKQINREFKISELKYGKTGC